MIDTRSAGPNLLRGLVLVTQPFPALMSAAAAAVFCLVAAPGSGADAAIVLFASVFLVCASFNALNDWCDVDLDRLTKPLKPVPHGDISAAGAMAVAVVAGAAGLLLSAWLDAGAFGVAVVALLAGIVYDLWAKGSVWSWVPYGVFIPALPVWGFLAAGRFSLPLLASFPLGVLVALALNLANTLPDLRGDTAYGLRGLTHRLGRERALALTWACFAVSLLLLAFTPWLLGNDPAILLPGLGLAALLLAAMIADRLIFRSEASLKRGWYASAILAAVLGVAWVASLPRP